MWLEACDVETVGEGGACACLRMHQNPKAGPTVPLSMCLIHALTPRVLRLDVVPARVLQQVCAGA